MHALLFLSFSALICSLSIVPFAESRKSLSSFSIDLIHHDSPSSPFYNSSMTLSEHTRNAALRSIARFNRVDQLSLNENGQSPQSIIVPNGGFGDYLMRIYIGTPPVERLAVADTGSDLIWVQCSLCQKESSCFPQNTPLFDPNQSSTFMPLPCDSQPCLQLPPRRHGCGNSNECNYFYGYGDGSFTIGELANDSINFGSTSGQGVPFPKSIFGCGYNNSVTFSGPGIATGLVGLGAGPLSLVSQLSDEIGHKFSYCLVPPASTSNSKLKFGDEAIISGNGVVSTPFTINSSSPTFYYLNLEGIGVGQNTAQSGQNGGSIIIDSGTTLTSLEPTLYNNFVASVKEALGVETVQNPPKPFDFCVTNNGASINLPDIVFHFTGADVSLKYENLFDIVENFRCLFVIPTTNIGGLSIYGNRAQINFQVEYDLEGKTVSFAPTDCTKN